MITNSVGAQLVIIPAGEFMMGSPTNESGRDKDEGPQQRVRITKPFYMGVTEVTQSQWLEVMNSNPSEFDGGRNPVERVSWDEATEFCRKLSARSAEQSASRVYRLPTEAEWEYACRGGTKTPWSFGDSPRELGAHSWYEENSMGSTHPVGEKSPNPFGLYDMNGNVSEWCSNQYFTYTSGVVAVVLRSDRGLQAYRGGAWSFAAEKCRSADRFVLHPVNRRPYLGFRLVISSSAE
jgi:formylglycine-generating enzyme required for sulfatase activity